jgi:hypothetical protein
MVNVYENEDCGNGRGNIVARVKYNEILGETGTGTSLGITKLSKSKRFVLIYGTILQGCKDYGIVVSDSEALQAVLAHNERVLDNYPELKAMSEKLECE